MFAADERQLDGNFAIYCLFRVGKEMRLIRATIGAGEPLEFPSITPRIAAAGW
jgi:Ni,Fe-hydrogenase III component G